MMCHSIMRHTVTQIISTCRFLGMEPQKLADDPPEAKMVKEFLHAMVNSPSKKKILVHFKFKYPAIEHQEWLTYKQYLTLRSIGSLDFCKVVT